jgi:hypothetical protein
MAEKKDIRYLNRDFASFKQALIDFSKTYFPNTYNDFSPASPGMMFMEQAAYIGDVLSFYQDNQFQELFTQYAKEKENLYAAAYIKGYRPKVTKAATANIDIYQIIPSISSASVVVPDFRYAMVLDPGVQIKSTVNDVNFFIKDKVDFSISSSFNPTELTVYQLNGGTGLPDYYLLKKTVQGISGEEVSTTFSFGAPERFPKVTLQDDNIIEITSVIDSDGNTWDEVPYLAQETIFEEVSNENTNDPNFYSFQGTTPYLLKLKKVPRRFVTRFKTNETMELQFGAGVTSEVDEVLIPNPDNVGLGIINGLSKINTAYDPSNFLYTKTYGVAPYNTTLIVKYLKGGGVESNIPANTLTDLNNVVSSFKFSNLDSVISRTVINSLAATNPLAAVGGGDGDTEDELRLNILASFPTQERAVTLDDYVVRSYALPSRFGVIAKSCVVQDSRITDSKDTDFNPLSISLYVISQGGSGQLTNASLATKQNLKTYLSQFRMLSDAINIRDAFIINIGVNFDITVRPNFNSQQIILNCIEAIQSYFRIDKWQINQPIILSELYVLLDKIDGVQTVKNVEIVNKTGESLGYSKWAYDIKGATVNRVVYPSQDPCIFELKFPQTDIQGRTSSY